MAERCLEGGEEAGQSGLKKVIRLADASFY